jgi:hypothetical protein
MKRYDQIPGDNGDLQEFSENGRYCLYEEAQAEKQGLQQQLNAAELRARVAESQTYPDYGLAEANEVLRQQLREKDEQLAAAQARISTFLHIAESAMETEGSLAT